jgi:hypothetical protein
MGGRTAIHCSRRLERRARFLAHAGGQRTRARLLVAIEFRLRRGTLAGKLGKDEPHAALLPMRHEERGAAVEQPRARLPRLDRLLRPSGSARRGRSPLLPRLLRPSGSARRGRSPLLPAAHRAHRHRRARRSLRPHDLHEDAAGPLDAGSPHGRMPRHYRRKSRRHLSVVLGRRRDFALPCAFGQARPLRLAEHVGGAGVARRAVGRSAAHVGALDRLALIVLQVHHQRARHLEEERHDGNHHGEDADDDGRLDLRRHAPAPEPGREAVAPAIDPVGDAVLHGQYSARLLSVSKTSTL